jgi:predicted sulfurtransferase
MISLDLTRRAIPVDTSKLYLVKGRKVSLCYHCKSSVSRSTLLRCNECRHDYCPNCLDACRCYLRPVARRRKPEGETRPHLGLVSSSMAHL